MSGGADPGGAGGAPASGPGRTGPLPTARDLGAASMAAVEAKDRDGWLALFEEDGIVEDPIGPSPFDPEGRGHQGSAAIAAFYDSVIATSESIRFTIRQSFLCGDEVANVGVIRITFPGGSAIDVDVVSTYRRSPSGKLAALRAYWELDAVRPVAPEPG